LRYTLSIERAAVSRAVSGNWRFENKIVDREDRADFYGPFGTRAGGVCDQPDYLIYVIGFNDGKSGLRNGGIGEGTFSDSRRSIPGADGSDPKYARQP
jgi:hypothetical protein